MLKNLLFIYATFFHFLLSELKFWNCCSVFNSFKIKCSVINYLNYKGLISSHFSDSTCLKSKKKHNFQRYHLDSHAKVNINIMFWKVRDIIFIFGKNSHFNFPFTFVMFLTSSFINRTVTNFDRIRSKEINSLHICPC